MTPTEKLIVMLLRTILENQISRGFFDEETTAKQCALLDAATATLKAQQTEGSPSAQG